MNGLADFSSKMMMMMWWKEEDHRRTNWSKEPPLTERIRFDMGLNKWPNNTTFLQMMYGAVDEEVLVFFTLPVFLKYRPCV